MLTLVCPLWNIETQHIKSKQLGERLTFKEENNIDLVETSVGHA